MGHIAIRLRLNVGVADNYSIGLSDVYQRIDRVSVLAKRTPVLGLY